MVRSLSSYRPRVVTRFNGGQDPRRRAKACGDTRRYNAASLGLRLALRTLEVRDQRRPSRGRLLLSHGDELPAVLTERVEDLSRVVLQQRRNEVLPRGHLQLLSHQSSANVSDADAHDDLEAALRGDALRFLAHDVFLEPEHAGADRD